MDKNEQKRLYKNRVRTVIRLYLQDYKTTRPCSCGEGRHYCLVFHHRDETEKEFTIAHSRDKSFSTIVAEVAKCKVMCANCHNALHFLDDTISRERRAMEIETDDQLLLFEN